ncbi:MAG: reductive dehalogenase [Deltaproteobacteria bacterium]|nr:reductive dehalogenase [Deltaproteobacteria bacterium]
MNETKGKGERKGISRRSFMKLAVAGPFVAAGTASAADLGKSKSARSATLGLLKEHESIDHIYEISPDYKPFDQINLLFSNMSSFNRRTNDPTDPDYKERQEIRNAFGMYVAKADGIVEIMRAVKLAGKSFDEFLAALGSHSIPFPPPVAKVLWENEKIEHLFERAEEKGWSQLDYAFENAGWSVDHFGARLSEGGVSGRFKHFVGGEMRDGLYAWNRPPWPTVYQFKDREEATRIVKKASLFLGADVVGIAPYDQRWVWKKRFNIYDGTHEENTLPFEPKSVIVFGFEMDYEAYKTTPSAIGDAAAGICYSKMAVTGHSVAEFIRKLGYQAIACGNDTASSVPLGIQAGLGEGSRMGPLINPFFGPRIRLSKVFTELELISDKPITFGVKEFCMTCKKCANACPAGAISFDDKPSFTVHSCVSNPGIAKWYLKADSCVRWWGEIGSDCGHCITVCPYNKPDLWPHRIAKVATHFPGTRRLAMALDDAFGYGKFYGTPENAKLIEDYWKRL